VEVLHLLIGLAAMAAAARLARFVRQGAPGDGRRRMGAVRPQHG
jgi:hypothetical protein